MNNKWFELDTIYRGDCKEILSMKKPEIEKIFQAYGESLPNQFVDLIYMDPPFFSNRKYEVIWGDGSEVRSFNDNHWYSSDGTRRKTIDAFLEFIRERVEKCYSILKPTGSFYLHCDWHASHYLKVMLDSIFGYNNFRNEIVWYYYNRWTAGKKDFQRVHDVILRYTKTNEYVFNIQYQPYSKSMEDGFQKNGYVKRSSPKKGDYISTKKEGVAMHDVWNISFIHSQSKERIGYPTQKPEALMERIIKSSSNAGDIVLDPFCGCGTTLASAYKLKRHFIGIDVSNTACLLVEDRLKKLGADVKYMGKPFLVKHTREMQHFDFQNFIIGGFGGRCNVKTGDLGIDGWDRNGVPIQVKKQDNVGREEIDRFRGAIDRYYEQLGNKNKKRMGIFVSYSLTSGAYNEIARLKKEGTFIEGLPLGSDNSNAEEIFKIWNDTFNELEDL